tara:strand:+ start:5896 stop:6189 length:294 start_codon:yes stop_codon:yes gene_type:complete
MSDKSIEEVLKRLYDIEKKIDNMTETVVEISKVTESFTSAEDIVTTEEAEKARDFIGSFVSNEDGGIEGMLESFKSLRSRMTDLSERISDVDKDKNK